MNRVFVVALVLASAAVLAQAPAPKNPDQTPGRTAAHPAPMPPEVDSHVATMGGGPMMTWQDYSKLTPEQLKQRQYMMDRWMPMQQMMMGHMMQQQSMMMAPGVRQQPAPAP